MAKNKTFAELVKQMAREAYKYYETQTQICPDAEDIWNDILNRLPERTGMDATKEQSDEVWRIVSGETGD